SGKILEGAHADMAGGNAGQDRARQDGLAHHAFAGDDSGKRSRGRNAQSSHRLAHNILAKYGSERGAAVAAARKWRRPGAVELDAAPDAVLSDHFARQDRAAIAELGHELPELVASIGHRDRVGARRQRFTRKYLGALGAFEQIRIEAQMNRQWPIQLDQPGSS